MIDMRFEVLQLAVELVLIWTLQEKRKSPYLDVIYCEALAIRRVQGNTD